MSACMSNIFRTKIQRIQFLILACALILGFVMVIVVPAFDASSDSQIRFSSSQWVGGDSTVRYQMRFDLIEGKVLIGLSEAQVKVLLGLPDRDEGVTWCYFVTRRRNWHPLDSFPIFHTNEWIAVQFGRESRCVVGVDLQD